MVFNFVQTNNFTPHLGQWTPIGNVTWQRNGNAINLMIGASGLVLQVSFLGPQCLRVRFQPVAAPDYTKELSFAVVNRALGAVNLAVSQQGNEVVVDTGQMTARIGLSPYRLRVLRNGQLICADEPSYNLVYIPGQEVIANFKTYPANALYCGFGEKAGGSLFKNQNSLTFFNFDDFRYGTGRIDPHALGNGPLEPSQPLYGSVPLILEVNPAPQGDYAGPPYCYGIFFDNPSQSYANLGLSDIDSSNMFGRYYFGALYGEMDYYLMVGGVGVADVLSQYTTLTGRAPMPPKYVFGFHQGAYGYFDHNVLTQVANTYRAARIPCDGLHIDVDFQDNYRTFTHSEIKFPNARAMFDALHANGFKCSTNVTPLLKDPLLSPLDENGSPTAYAQHDALYKANGLIFDVHFGQGSNSDLYVGKVNYGNDQGTNPYMNPGTALFAYPPLKQDSSGKVPLAAWGNYPDFGNAFARQAWGEQYSHLIHDLGMDMIWQDMMCPAIDFGGGDDADSQPKTFPLDLMMDRGDGTLVPNAKIHNIYGLKMLSASWNGINQIRQQNADNKRNFIIARGGYAGMQRFAGLWTGDSPSDWAYLAIYIPQVLNLGLSGIPISGSDIGGFAGGNIPDGTTAEPQFHNGRVFEGITNYELLTRWMQVGAFLPWYRNHFDGYNKQFQEPFAYGEPVPTICRSYVELRYRLLQLFYDLYYEWTQTGMPVCRPLFLNDPNDPAVYGHCDDQFFVGRDLLIAPIVSQHITTNPPSPPIRQVYLPAASQWYAFKDNRVKLDPAVPGGTLIPDWYASLDLVPIYVRAGAILPTRELEQYVGQLAQNPLTFNIYPGPDSTYRSYLDDGITLDAQTNNRFRITDIRHIGIPGGQQINVDRVSDNYLPPETFFFVALPGTRHPSAITLNGLAVPDVGTNQPANLQAATAPAYYWNSDIEVTFVKVFDTLPNLTLVVLF
jgi:alpha-glucosidase